MTVQIYLMRHGETTWSLTGQHTSITDLSLTPNGQAQAQALRPLLARQAFAHVLSSPRKRAMETCAIAGLGDAMTCEPDLAEWAYGDYEGRTTRDIRQARPGWQLFADGCPGGETPEEVSARADRIVARLRALDGAVAVFSHGDFSRAIATRWIGAPVALGIHLAIDVASLSVLGYNARHHDTPVIVSWNQTGGASAQAAATTDV